MHTHVSARVPHNTGELAALMYTVLLQCAVFYCNVCALRMHVYGLQFHYATTKA